MSAANSSDKELQIAIIGAGPGGLCMGIRLKQSGFENFVIVEKADGVGGTWYHNRYPGCACDIPSHLYSFSFELNRSWSRPYSPQPEIRAYFERCAEKYGLMPHCRLGSGVASAKWDDATSRWTLALDDGSSIEADVVVGAVGMFNDLAEPEIEGLEAFAGTTFHSARWNWDHDLTGENVAVIGSAASAVQFVPEIVKQAEHVQLYQRTANWVLPKQDDPFTAEQLAHFDRDENAVIAMREEIFGSVDVGSTFQNPVALAEMESYGLANLELVEDEATREKLRPRHPFGCKRPLVSNDYYPAFNRSNLELVTEGIERITKDSIVACDGVERPVDTLILASGFAATKYLSSIDVEGRGGKRLSDAWNDGAIAYLGITTSGFPNLFMLYGPNTNNGSILTMIESQVEYTLRHIEEIQRNDLAWIDVRPGPMADYNEEIQEGILGVKVWQAGCNGYYRTPSGRVVTQWPFTMSEFGRRTDVAAVDPDVFEVGRR